MVADKDIQFLKGYITKQEAIQLAIRYGGLGSSLKEQGFWDASANDPSLEDGIGTIGFYYVVSVGGTVDFGDGDITFTAGDWVYYNTANEWVKFETGVDYVPVNKAGDTMTGDLAFSAGKGVLNTIITDGTPTRTLALTDAFSYIRTLNGSGVAITIPPNADVAFEVGTQIDFSQQGAGVLSFVAGSGVTINTTSLVMSARYGGATIIKVATNEWDLIIG